VGTFRRSCAAGHQGTTVWPSTGEVKCEEGPPVGDPSETLPYLCCRRRRVNAESEARLGRWMLDLDTGP
jgi:hypothetical protein